MILKRLVLGLSFICSMMFLYSSVSHAAIRTYITESELATVKAVGSDIDDRIYDNFNSNHIYLHWSRNLDSKYNRGIYSDGFYNDDGSTGTWIDPSDESLSFEAEFRIDFSAYDKHLISTQHIYPYVRFYVAPNNSGLNDTAKFNLRYNSGLNDSWPDLSGFTKSVTGVSSYQQWNFGGSMTTYIPTNASRLTFKWHSEDSGSDDTAFYDVDIYFVDKTRPTIQSIYTDTSGAKKIGDTIQIKVRMNEKVNQSGSKLLLNLGSNVYANYVSKTDSTTYSTLIYEYTVKEGDNVSKLDVSSTQAYFEENIWDLAGNVANNVSDFATVSTVDSNNIRVDGIRPRIGTFTSNSNNTIKTNGDTIVFTATFNENVNITSAPTLSLSNGVQIAGTTGSNTNTCTFTYNIGASTTETSSNLQGTGISGGVIKDIAGNSLTNYLSLSNTVSGVKVDNTPPSVSFTPNGNTAWAQSHAITINASDSLSGLAGNVYYYALVLEGSTLDSTAKYSQINYSNSYVPGQSLTLSGLSGKYKVYIKAVDNSGNITYMRTSTFYLDNLAPTISFSADYSSPKLSHSVDVALSDSLSGISAISYKWYKEGETVGDTGYTAWSDYSSSTKTLTYQAPADGKYRVAIRVRDNVSLLATSQSEYFYFDKTPPQISVTETNGYGFESNRSSYSVQIAATDPNGTNADGTIQYTRYRWEATSDLVELSTGWTDVPGSAISYNNGGASGEKYLHVVSRDNAADGIAANRTYNTYRFTFDGDGPVISSTSSNFTGITSQATVNVSVSDALNPIATAFYAFRDATLGENTTGIDWQALTISSGTVSQSVTKSDGTGAFKLHVKAYDSQGNTSYYTSPQIMLDNEAGTGGINILETYDKDGTVNVTFDLSEDPAGYLYKISENGVDYSAYSTYVNSASYTFTDTTEGSKDIYVVYKDSLGNETQVYSDSVIIDKTPPTATVQYTPEEAAGVTNQNVTAALTSIADNISLSENLAKSAESMVFTSNGSGEFFVTDQAGNTATITATVTWIDKQGAVISCSPMSNLTPSKSKDIIISAVKEGHAVTLSYTVIDENGVEIQPNQNINSGGTVSLAGNGNQYINVIAIDDIGNITQLQSGPYVLDNTRPVATIVYSTETRTANNVTATLSLNEGDVTNNGGLKTYTFEDNGSFTFEFSDAAGNTGTATANVTWIDRTTPSANITLSETEMTKNDVAITISVETLERAEIASVTYSEPGLTLVSSKTRTPAGLAETVVYEYTYRVDRNGALSIYMVDVDTLQETTSVVNISNIDKEPPACSFHLSETAKTTHNIDVTVTYADVVSNPSTILPPVEVTDLGSNVYRVTENGTYTFKVVDSLGNEGLYPLTIDNIDREIYPQIVYSTTDPTNQDVVATVHSADEELFAINNNERLSYTFTENGTFTFQVRDSAGNVSEVTAMVEWINKTGVEVTLTPSSIVLTNQDIIIMVEPIDAIQSVASVENLVLAGAEPNVFTVTQNGTYHFEVTDVYGNVINESIYIDNIDKTPPAMDVVIEVDTVSGRQYLQEGDVLPITGKPIRIDFSDEEAYEFITVPAGVSIYKKYNIATIVDNGTYVFTVRDLAGNERSKTITFNNFDTVPPNVTVTYNTVAPTNKDVIATVTSNEEIRVINNFNSVQKVFKENGTFTFIVSDVAGNEVAVQAVVANIDKTPPEITLTYSTIMPTKEDVTVTLSANEPFTVLNNGGNTSYIFSSNESVYFTVSDAQGNQTTVEARAANIDKAAPRIIVASEAPILVPLNEAGFNFADYAYVDSYGDANRPIQVDVSGVDFSVPGSYQVVFSVTDAVGNVGTKTKAVDIIDISEPLGVRLNGLNPEEYFVLHGDAINISLFNAFDQESIYYIPQKTSVTEVKAVGIKLSGKILQVEKSGWYSILIRDKDANYRFYQVFIAK